MVSQQTFLDGMEKGENNEDEITLLKVPENYDGLSYTAISDETKISNLELRRLLNRKSTEASSSAAALNDLACMIASGLGTKKNMRMAVAHFLEAVGKNNLFAMLNLAKLYQPDMRTLTLICEEASCRGLAYQGHRRKGLS